MKSDSAPGRQLYSIAEARERLGIGRTYLWELVRAGRLPVIRLGRRVLVASDDLEAFIDRNRDLERLGASHAFGDEVRRLAELAPSEVRERLFEIAEEAGGASEA